MLRYFLLAVLGILGFPILVVLLVMGMFGWQYFNSRGIACFGRPQAERQHFKRQVARRSSLATCPFKVVDLHQLPD